MTTVTGTYNKVNGNFKMHSPKFPYDSITYVGYTLQEMKKKYRADYDLQHKRIEWIILGLEEG